MKSLLASLILLFTILLSRCSSGGSSYYHSTYLGPVPTTNNYYNPSWNPYTYNYNRNSLNLYYHGGLSPFYNGGYPTYYNYPYNYSFPYYNRSGSLTGKRYHKDFMYHGHQ